MMAFIVTFFINERILLPYIVVNHVRALLREYFKELIWHCACLVYLYISR